MHSMNNILIHFFLNAKRTLQIVSTRCFTYIYKRHETIIVVVGSELFGL